MPGTLLITAWIDDILIRTYRIQPGINRKQTGTLCMLPGICDIPIGIYGMLIGIDNMLPVIYRIMVSTFVITVCFFLIAIGKSLILVSILLIASCPFSIIVCM